MLVVDCSGFSGTCVLSAGPLCDSLCSTQTVRTPLSFSRKQPYFVRTGQTHTDSNPLSFFYWKPLQRGQKWSLLPVPNKSHSGKLITTPPPPPPAEPTTLRYKELNLWIPRQLGIWDSDLFLVTFKSVYCPSLSDAMCSLFKLWKACSAVHP